MIDARRIGPTAPPRVSVGDGRRPKRDASTLLSVAAGLLFVLLWSASRIATGIVVQADEGSYLLNAAAIAGKLRHSELIYEYYSGYSLLIAPAFLIGSGYASVYAIALAINALLIASIPVALFVFVTRIAPDEEPSVRLWASICAGCYASTLALSQYALSDNALAATYAWALATGAVALRERRHTAAAISGLLLGFLFDIHARGAPLAAPVMLALLAHAWARREARTIVAVLCVATVVAGSLHGAIEHLAGKGHGFVAAGFSLREVLARFDTLETWLQALVNVGGVSFVAIAGSMGALTVLLTAAARELKSRRSLRDIDLAYSIACIGGLIGCIATTAAFFIPPGRADQLVYGRYLMPAMPPVVALGFLALKKQAPCSRRDVAAVVLPGIVIAGLSGLAFHLLRQHFDPHNWIPLNSVELYVPFRLAGGLDWLALGIWSATTTALIVGIARWSSIGAFRTFAAINIGIGVLLFCGDTVYSRKYYAKDRLIADTARVFRETTGVPLCVTVDPKLSGWHQIDFRVRLYDQLGSSVRSASPSCIPGTISSEDATPKPVDGTIMLARESTSPSGPFAVDLRVPDGDVVRSFAGSPHPELGHMHPLPGSERVASTRLATNSLEDIRLAPGEIRTVRVVVTNTSSTTWYSRGNYPVLMGVGIKSEAQGAPHASRRAFEHDVQPWKAVTIDVPLGPLAQPGRYVATISVLQEGVAWFGRPVTLGIVVADDAPH